MTTLQIVHKAVIVPTPPKALLSFPAGVLTRDGADVPQAAVFRGPRRITICPAPTPPQQQLPGTWVWGGLLYHHFGHFLCETAVRLWALPALASSVSGVVFIAKRPDLTAEGTLLFDWISRLAPGLPIRILHSPTRVQRLICPPAEFGLGPLAKGTPRFRKTMQRALTAGLGPPGSGPPVYVSRSQLGPRKGGLIGEAHLDHALAQQGVRILHPQTLPLRDQIAAYHAAPRILAAEGSALHLIGMIARPPQSVAIIQRRARPAAAIVTQLTAALRRPPRLINALSEIWRPQTPNRPHIGMAALDMTRLKAALVTHGFVPDTANWPDLPRADIKGLMHKSRYHRRAGFAPVPVPQAPP